MHQPINSPSRPLKLSPTFGRGFRAIWLLTWRTRLAGRKIPGLCFGLLFVPILTWVSVDPVKTEAYFHWLLDIYFLMMVPLFCLGVFGGMIRDEIQADTLGFLLTRPVSRAKLFLLKYLSHVIWVQLSGLITALLIFAAGLGRQIPELISLLPVFLFAQMLAILAYGALSSFFGLLTQRYIVLGIVYGFVVEMGIGRIPTNIHSLSLSHHIRTILGNSKIVQDLYHWPPERALFSIAMMLLASVVAVAGGMMLFTWKEYHHTEEMQK